MTDGGKIFGIFVGAATAIYISEILLKRFGWLHPRSAEEEFKPIDKNRLIEKMKSDIGSNNPSEIDEFFKAYGFVLPDTIFTPEQLYGVYDLYHHIWKGSPDTHEIHGDWLKKYSSEIHTSIHDIINRCSNCGCPISASACILMCEKCFTKKYDDYKNDRLPVD